MTRLIELVKTILIVLLICSLVLLTVASVPTHTLREIPWLSTLLQPIAPLIGLPQAELAYVAAAPAIQDAAKPLVISVNNSAGRSTAQWSFTELDTRFDSLGRYLGQALDTAETFTKVSQPQLQTALTAESIYFGYGAPLPPAVVASWLGASLEAAVPDTEAFLLSVNGSAVELYLMGETAYVSATPLSAAELRGLLDNYRPDSSCFAFETDYPLPPLTLIPGEQIVLSGGSATDSVTGRFVEQLATDLGFNPYGESRYTDNDGGIHFSEANCALEITTGGQILLTAAEGRFEAAGPDQAALAELARQLTDLATGGNPGRARLYLTGITETETGTVCTFDYHFSGIPVMLDRGSAATVTFTGQSVTGMTVHPYTFSANAENIYPLPIAQAAALLPDGTPLTLRYRLTADGVLEAGWKK